MGGSGVWLVVGKVAGDVAQRVGLYVLDREQRRGAHGIWKWSFGPFWKAPARRS